MGRTAVARHYLQGWFTLDFVASFPIDLLFLGRRLDIWRLPRLLKIIRVLHYKTLIQAGTPLILCGVRCLQCILSSSLKMIINLHLSCKFSTLNDLSQEIR